MKLYNSLRILLTVFCSFNLMSSLVFASSSPAEDRKNVANVSESSSPEYELDLTIYFRAETFLQSRLYKDSGQRDLVDYLALSVGLDAYYGNFFIERSNRYSQNNQTSAFGYRLVDNRDYQLDILLGQSYLDYLSENDGNVYRDEPSEALAGIDERDNDFSQGFRFTQFDGNKAWWIDVAGDLFKDTHGGWLIDTYYSQLHQVINWEIQIGFGATYFSNKMVDYYAGIKAHEVTAERPFYKPGNGSRVTLEVSAQYPLSSNWVFITGASIKKYSDSFSKSPLYKRGQQTSLNMGIVYVW